MLNLQETSFDATVSRESKFTQLRNWVSENRENHGKQIVISHADLGCQSAEDPDNAGYASIYQSLKPVGLSDVVRLTKRPRGKPKHTGITIR